MIRSALAVAWLLLLSAPAAAERGEELERLRDAIRASRDRVATYEREERGLLETMEALDRTAYLLTRDAAEARHRAREARSDLAEIEVEAQRLEGQLEQTRRAMGKRAVALYRTGEVGAVTLLFSSGGLREFLSRVSALRLLLTHDAELIGRHRAETAALSATRDRVAESASRLSRAEERARERSQQLNAERQTKRRLVARLHADRTRARGALVELEKAAEAFEATLQALRDAPERPSDPLVGPAFASLQRRLDPPVDAPIVAEFGRVVDAEFHTETMRTGVEFDAKRGTSVRAVAAGTVRFAGWFRGYGRLVILDHGDQYFTVSGHLDEIRVEVGDRVQRAAGLGTVGETGSLAGARLYFEIRRGGTPLDPRDWLASS